MTEIKGFLVKLVIILIIAGGIVACGGDEKKYDYRVEGKLSNSNNEYVEIYKLSPLSVSKKDSSKLDDRGRFSMDFTCTDTPELFILKVKNYPQRITLLLNAGEKVNITGDAYYLNKTYRTEGSKGSAALRNLAHMLNKLMDKGDSLYLAFRSSKDTANIKQRAAKTDSLLLANYTFAHDFVVKFCLNNRDNLAGVVGLYSKYGTENILDFKSDFDVFKKVAFSIIKKYPDNEHALSLYKRVDDFLQEKEHKQEIEKTLEAGNKAPVLILPTPEGKRLDLASFKGKYLALYFWISKEKDCWDTNEKLKNIYKKYKGKDFDILSVSMEKDKLLWVNTIALNRINWPQVLADENTYKAYNLDDKPRLFLIDPEGIIKAKDITADSLERIVEQAL